MPIDKLFNSPQTKTALTGALSGAAGGALVSAFTNKKSAKKMLKAGGLVALGGVAWHAFQQYRERDTGPQESPNLSQAEFEAVVAPDRPSCTLLLEAMVSAAHADGHLSDTEQQQIWQRAVEENTDRTVLAGLTELMAEPTPMAEIVARADRFETRMEVYTAALVVIEEGSTEGERYLGDLATALRLPPGLVTALHDQAQSH